MKSALCSLALALSLLSLVTPSSSATNAAGPSATGGGTISLEDDLKRHFEFEAVTHEDGSVTGHISLNDPAEIQNQDVDGTGETELEGSPSGIELTVVVDSMKVKDNRAVLSGTVTSTNMVRYASLRVIFTVEDNGEGKKATVPDKITWGVYARAVERLAMDAENPDAGIYLIGEREFDSDTFPLSSYSLNAIDEGNIQVRP